MFTEKQGSLDGDTIRYKARLITKGYMRLEGVNYNKVFSPIVKHSLIQILLAIEAQYELEIDQLNVKTSITPYSQNIYTDACPDFSLVFFYFIYLLFM